MQVYREMPEEEITEDFLWGRLRPLLGYLSAEDISKVREALSLATDAHAGQWRKSGEPFITHPLEVRLCTKAQQPVLPCTGIGQASKIAYSL